MRVQLWLEKIGKIKPNMYHIAQAFNNVEEEKALGDYMEMTRNSVLIPKSFHVHHEHSWLGASPDGIIESDSGGVLEIKIRYSEGGMREAFRCKQIPLYYMPQTQGLMEITDLDWMHFYVWTPNGSRLFEIYGDVQYWELLKTALSDFWWNHVEPAKKKRDEAELRLLTPGPRPQDDLFALIVYYNKVLVDNSELLDVKLGRKSQHLRNRVILNRRYYTVYKN